MHSYTDVVCTYNKIICSSLHYSFDLSVYSVIMQFVNNLKV